MAVLEAADDEAVPEVDEVDEVVVDRAWGISKSASDPLTEGGDSSGFEKGVNGGGGGIHHFASMEYSGTTFSREQSLLDASSRGFCSAFVYPLRRLKGRLYPVAVKFFSCRFHDQKAEQHYRKEIWFQAKVRSILYPFEFSYTETLLVDVVAILFDLVWIYSLSHSGRLFSLL